MQNFYDIARIFKHYPGDEGYDINHSQHKTSMRDAVHSYDDLDERPDYDDEYDAEMRVKHGARQSAAPGTVYSSRSGSQGGWEGDPATGKRGNPFDVQEMEKGDYGSEEIYSMGNRGKTMVQKMQYLFKAKGNLAAELDRQAQSSASVRGGPEGAGGTGSFDEAQQIGRGAIDSTIGLLYGRGQWGGGPSSSNRTSSTEEGAPTVEGTAVPDNTPRTQPDPTAKTQTSNQTRTKTPTGPVQNPMQEIGAQPKAGGKKGAYQPPKGAPKPAGQQYYAQDLKMVEKMARIFRV